MTRKVEALKWLEQGGAIHFSNDPLVAESYLLVLGLYEEGAKRVEVLLCPTSPEDVDMEPRTLVITLSDEYNKMLSAMFEIGILTPNGPIIQDGKTTVIVTWEDDRERLPDGLRIGIEKGSSTHGTHYVPCTILNSESATTYNDGTVVDFGGTLDRGVIELLKETGALVDPMESDPDDKKRAIGMEIVLPESYDKALECMIIIALLGLDVGSTMVSEPTQLTRIAAYTPDDLLA